MIHRRAPFLLQADAVHDRPKILVFDGVEWTRFMDNFYVDRPLRDLTVAEVLILCEWRLHLPDRTIETDTYRAMTNALAATLDHLPGDPTRRRILDFGSGDGRASVFLDAGTVVAVDGSFASLGVNPMPNRIQCNAEAFPFRDNAFDVVFAAFVFHFPLSDATMRELRRVTDGWLLYNIYGPDIEHTVEQLTLAGLTLVSRDAIDDLLHEVHLWRRT